MRCYFQKVRPPEGINPGLLVRPPFGRGDTSCEAPNDRQIYDWLAPETGLGLVCGSYRALACAGGFIIHPPLPPLSNARPSVQCPPKDEKAEVQEAVVIPRPLSQQVAEPGSEARAACALTSFQT